MKRPLPPLITPIDVVAVGDSEISLLPSGPGAQARIREVPVWWSVVAVALALVAAVSTLLWWQHQSRVVLSVSRVTAAQPGNIDASGCPVGVSCESRAQATNELTAAVLRDFPGSVVLESTSRVASGSQKVVFTNTVLQTANSVVISISAQCVPDAGAVPQRHGALSQLGPADEILIVAGQRGCSVVVVAHVPAGARVPARQLTTIASDPAVQLSR
jgi:hypothetical protein